MKERLPFEGESTYRQEFHAKQAERAEVVAEAPVRPHLPFDGRTSYNAEFTAKAGERPAVAPSPTTPVCEEGGKAGRVITSFFWKRGDVGSPKGPELKGD